MSMTADQIRKALAPMKDFAPAILAAAEIVESAVAADATLKELAGKTASIEAEIDRLKKRVPKAQAESASAQAQLSDIQRQLHEAEVARDAKLNAYRLDDTAAAQEHADTLATYQRELQDVKDQIRIAVADLEDVKTRLRDFKKAIPA